MTPKAQRIAIATACGCVYHRPTEEEVRSGSYYQYEPDYLNSLHLVTAAARYCAEHVMNADQWEEFGRLLEHAHPTAVLLNHVGDKTTLDYYDLATLMTGLTAAQYAECLLKALGKWTE